MYAYQLIMFYMSAVLDFVRQGNMVSFGAVLLRRIVSSAIVSHVVVRGILFTTKVHRQQQVSLGLAMVGLVTALYVCPRIETFGTYPATVLAHAKVCGGPVHRAKTLVDPSSPAAVTLTVTPPSSSDTVVAAVAVVPSTEPTASDHHAECSTALATVKAQLQLLKEQYAADKIKTEAALDKVRKEQLKAVDALQAYKQAEADRVRTADEKHAAEMASMMARLHEMEALVTRLTSVPTSSTVGTSLPGPAAAAHGVASPSQPTTALCPVPASIAAPTGLLPSPLPAATLPAQPLTTGQRSVRCGHSRVRAAGRPHYAPFPISPEVRTRSKDVRERKRAVAKSDEIRSVPKPAEIGQKVEPAPGAASAPVVPDAAPIGKPPCAAATSPSAPIPAPSPVPVSSESSAPETAKPSGADSSVVHSPQTPRKPSGADSSVVHSPQTPRKQITAPTPVTAVSQPASPSPISGVAPEQGRLPAPLGESPRTPTVRIALASASTWPASLDPPSDVKPAQDAADTDDDGISPGLDLGCDLEARLCGLTLWESGVDAAVGAKADLEEVSEPAFEPESQPEAQPEMQVDQAPQASPEVGPEADHSRTFEANCQRWAEWIDRHCTPAALLALGDYPSGDVEGPPRPAERGDVFRLPETIPSSNEFLLRLNWGDAIAEGLAAEGFGGEERLLPDVDRTFELPFALAALLRVVDGLSQADLDDWRQGMRSPWELDAADLEAVAEFTNGFVDDVVGSAIEFDAAGLEATADLAHGPVNDVDDVVSAWLEMCPPEATGLTAELGATGAGEASLGEHGSGLQVPSAAPGFVWDAELASMAIPSSLLEPTVAASPATVTFPFALLSATATTPIAAVAPFAPAFDVSQDPPSTTPDVPSPSTPSAPVESAVASAPAAFSFGPEVSLGMNVKAVPVPRKTPRFFRAGKQVPAPEWPTPAAAPVLTVRTDRKIRTLPSRAAATGGVRGASGPSVPKTDVAQAEATIPAPSAGPVAGQGTSTAGTDDATDELAEYLLFLSGHQEQQGSG